jgi:hypothetical protein
MKLVMKLDIKIIEHMCSLASREWRVKSRKSSVESQGVEQSKTPGWRNRTLDPGIFNSSTSRLFDLSTPLL